MVSPNPAQQPSKPEETLSNVWRSAVREASPIVAALTLFLGAAGLTALFRAQGSRFHLVLGWGGAVLFGFGLDSLAVRARNAEPSTNRIQVAVSIGARLIAAIGGLMVGLLVLRALFGDRIEVMRR